MDDTNNQAKPTDDITEVVVKVKPGKDYSAELKKGQRLKLVLDQRDGRLWSIEDRPDDLADEKPEGRPAPDPQWTWIYFTPKNDVVGTAHIRLITTKEYGPDGTGDFSKGQTSIVYLSVNTQ
jgi:hypothetical protein